MNRNAVPATSARPPEFPLPLQRSDAIVSLNWISPARTFSAVFLASGGTIWTGIELTNWIFNKTVNPFSPAISIATFLIAPMTLATAGTIMRLMRTQKRFQRQHEILVASYTQLAAIAESQSDTPGPIDDIISALHNAYKEERWKEVIRTGAVLSRPLWISGQYDLRIQVGKLVEAAASFTQDHRTQAAALIDDLGWTLFITGRKAEAVKNITHGMRIAEEHDAPDLTLKALRHLVGIHLATGEIQTALTNQKTAESIAESITDRQECERARAGLLVSRGLIDRRAGNLSEALTAISTAKDKYEATDDRDRAAKLYPFLGDILYELGRTAEAKDTYREGLQIAKALSRQDGILKCYVGLGNVAVAERDHDAATGAYASAAIAARALSRVALANELERAAHEPQEAPVRVDY